MSQINLTDIATLVAAVGIIIPYLTVVLEHVNSKRLDKVAKAARRITTALEETDLDGQAKKTLAGSKLEAIVKSMPFFKLTPDQLDDFIDDAVNNLRQNGVKQNVFIETPED